MNANPAARRPYAAVRGAGQALAARLRELLTPLCIVCGVEPVSARGDPEESEARICAGCIQDYFPPEAARCRICAIRLPNSVGPDTCGSCLVRPPAFDASIALADYLAPVDGMVAALKFRSRLDIGRAFGCLLAGRVRRIPWACGYAGDAIVPLPLAAPRLRERGFNQAEEIARAAAARLRIPVLPGVLLRVRHAAPQQGLRLAQRRTNIRGAFRVPRNLQGRRLFLVDDVMTTGSTLEEAAACLRSAGAGAVVNLVVARTP